MANQKFDPLTAQFDVEGEESSFDPLTANFGVIGDEEEEEEIPVQGQAFDPLTASFDVVESQEPFDDYTPSSLAKQFGGDDRDAQRRVDVAMSEIQSGAMPSMDDDDALPGILHMVQSDKPLTDSMLEYVANPSAVDTSPEAIAKAKQKIYEKNSRQYALSSSGGLFRPRVVQFKSPTYQEVESVVDQALESEGVVPEKFNKSSTKFDKKEYDKLVKEQFDKMASYPVPAQTVSGETVGQYTPASITEFAGFSPESIYEATKDRGDLQAETPEDFAAGPAEDTSGSFPLAKAMTTTLMTGQPDVERKKTQLSGLQEIARLEAMASMLERAEKGQVVKGSPAKILNVANTYSENAPESVKKFQDKNFVNILDPEGNPELTPKSDMSFPEFVGNVQRQLVETVGVIPAIGYYGYYAVKNDRDVVDDITTFAPAVASYLYNEVTTDFGRFAYNNPLDALGLATLGTGAIKGALGKTAQLSSKAGATSLAKGFQASASAFDLAYRATNPVELGRMTIGGIGKKAFEIGSKGYVRLPGPGGGKYVEIKSPAVRDFMTKGYLSFLDPSELGGMVLKRPDGSTTTLHDLFYTKDGNVAAELNGAKGVIEQLKKAKLSDEAMESMRDMLFGELESGSKLYIETPANATQYSRQVAPLAKASAESLELLDGKAQKLERALDQLDQMKESLPQRKVSADELDASPDLIADDMVIDRSVKSSALDSYDALSKEADDLLRDYQNTFDDVFKEHIDQTVKAGDGVPNTHNVKYKTQEEFFKSPNSRFQVELIDGKGSREVKYFPNETYNKFRYADFTRKQADEAIATGGFSSSKTFSELVQRFKAGEKIGFVADNIVTAAYNLRLFDEAQAAFKIAQDAGEKIDKAKLDNLRELRRESRIDDLGPDELRFLGWVGDTFDIPSMKDAVGVYSTKMPDGSTASVQQLGSPQLHAAQIRTRIMQLGAAAVDAGLLSESIYMKRLSDYFPHFYELARKQKMLIDEADKKIKGLRKLAEKSPNPAKREKILAKMQEEINLRDEIIREADGIRDELAGGKPVTHKHFKKESLRGKSFEEKLDKGLIENPVKAGLGGIINLSNDVETRVFYNELAKMTGPDGIKFISDQPTQPGWKRIPNNETKYGPLANKYVSPEGYHYLIENQKFTQSSILGKALTEWKALATLYNLPTHVRNVFSNFAFLGMYAGNPFIPTNASARKAWGLSLLGKGGKNGVARQAWTFKGKDVEAAIKDKAIGTDFTAAELKQAEKLWPKAEETLKKFGEGGEVGAQLGLSAAPLMAAKALVKAGKAPFQFLRKLYQWEENVFKLARYKQVKILQAEFAKTKTVSREMKRVFGSEDDALKALDVDEASRGRVAATEANKLFFDYGDTSDAVNLARRTFSPFITFQYKAIPRIADFMHKNPLRAFFYRRAFETLNLALEYGDQRDISRQEILEREKERRALPEYIRATGIRLPVEEDRTFSGIGEVPASQYADVQYMTPAGGLLQRASGYEGGMFPAMFSALEMSNPVVTVLGNQFYNKDSFTQRELVNDAMSPIEGYTARFKNFFQTLAPQMRAYQAFQEAKDQLPYRGYEGAVVPDWHEFVGDKIFGFKKRIVMKGNYDKLIKAYERKRNIIKREFNRALLDANLTKKSEEERRKIIDKFEAKFTANDDQLTNDIRRAEESTDRVSRILKK